MTDGAWRGGPGDPGRPGYRGHPQGGAEPEGYWGEPGSREPQPHPNDSQPGDPYGGAAPYPGGHPAGGGYQDGGYPPGGYPPGGYRQPAQPQPGYPQPGYPQQGQPQPGYPQPGQPPQAYPSDGLDPLTGQFASAQPAGPGYAATAGYAPGAPAGGHPSPGPAAADPAGGRFPAMGQPATGPTAGGYPPGNGWDEPTDTRSGGTSVRRALVPRAGAARTSPRPQGATGAQGALGAAGAAGATGAMGAVGAVGTGQWPVPANTAGTDPRYGTGPRGDLHQQGPARSATAPPRVEPVGGAARSYRDADPDGPGRRDRDPDRAGQERGLSGRGADAGRGADPDGRDLDGRDLDGRDALGGAERAGTGPRRRPAARRRGFGDADPGDEPDFPAEVGDDDFEDDYPGGEDTGLGPFLRRLVIALVVLGVALGVGVGAGVVWEKVRPSGDDTTSATGATGTEPSATPTTAAGATTPAPSAAASAQPQVTVPADWVAYTDAVQKATFSHPGSWKQRQDNTGVFFGEPGAGAAGTSAEYGPQMIGVARVAGADAATALSKVQAGEFGSVSGLSQDRSGAATDSSGAPTQELAGSYDRDGQRVSYLMRTVDGSGAVYVLIARVPAEASGTLNTLMAALRASFQPVT